MMASGTLRAMLVVGLLFATHGQSVMSSSGHCTYTFDCDHNSQGDADDQLLKNSVVILQTQVQTLVDEVANLRTDNARLQQQLAAINAGDAESSNRSAANLKQCSRQNLNDEREHGMIWTCDFVKKRQDTVLRVAWNGDTRLIHVGAKGASCRRWFFTLNGIECSQPKPIETQLHVQSKINNMHRPTYVQGYCRGVAAGSVRVGWNVGDCHNQSPSYDVGNAYTGWIATVRIIVEEVLVNDADETIL